MKVLQEAKNLLEAIECNYLSCKEVGIDDTGSYIKQMSIADEMEALEKAIKLKEAEE